MNKQQAVKLLNETFSNEFDIDRFLAFTKELLKKADLQVEDQTRYIPNEFKEYISEVKRLGEYKTNKKVLQILSIKLARESSKQRARTMQRNFIGKWLSKFEHDAALVAFHDGTEDWRFSFVKMEYQLVKEEGKVKAKTQLTPAKRYSYLVGKHEPNHTCKKQFLELVLADEKEPNLEELENAFSVEKVTKEFFERYKDLFLRLKESLGEVIKKDKNVAVEFANKGIDTIEFAKKLLGQIVFLYFLQKKGWLGVRKDKTGKFMPWGTGPKDFMRRLYNKEYCTYNNFFDDVLEPLFYNTLALKRTDDFSDKFDSKIPFLNGGLFEPLDGYDWLNTNIHLENAIFGDIFDTFDEFNFTVKEDEPLEREVAVDPEMLGKVFENLLEVTDRKSKGAFYTPREIVHYMCQQSLINYLETNTSIPRADIEKFIREGDELLDQTIRAQEHKKKYNGNTYDIDVEYTIPKSIEEKYLDVDRLLREIKVVDPAVGSGAFPVGMMNEIVKARSILSVFFSEDRDTYDLKRECIENSLYGVDIMPSAVDICQLRFWLSLIVDELDKNKVKPLPNLDNKIMCGNSLLEEFEGIKLFDDSLLGQGLKDARPELSRLDNEIKELNLQIGQIVTGKQKGNIDDLKKSIKKLEKEKSKLTAKEITERDSTLLEIGEQKIKESKLKLVKIRRLQKEFFSEYDGDKKKELKKEIEKLEWELIKVTLEEQGNKESLEKLKSIMKSKSKPFFLWKLYFADVFQRDNTGFDIVIANPPYLEFDEIRLKDSNFLTYRDGFNMKYKFNLYSLFLKKGPELLRTGGVITYIVPNSFSKEKYNENIRETYLKDMKVVSFVDFTQEKRPIFENASNDSYIVFVIEKTKINRQQIKVDRYDNKNFVFSHLVKQEELIDSFDYQFNISINTELVKKIQMGKIELGTICLIRVGLTPSKPYKKKYGDDYDNFKTKYAHNPALYTFLRRNKKEDTCDKWRIRHKTDYLIWDRDSLYKDKVCPGEFEDYHNPKLIFRNRGTAILGSFDGENIFVSDIFNVVVLKSKYKRDRVEGFNETDIKLATQFEEKYLLSIINSKLMTFYLSNNFVFRDIKAPMMRKFPIEHITLERQRPFIRLVDQILSITKDSDYLENSVKQSKVKKIENEIDQLVYKLYYLAPSEIDIIEQFTGERL